MSTQGATSGSEGFGSSEMPKYAPISRAALLLGIQRSTIYKLAGNGDLRLLKVGGRTLVDIDHALEFMASRPLAEISPPRKPKGGFNN